ncbi:uncharacterized protein LOC132293530 [Cornus florida]|uniref:uncharacterized protein LOC132293530 n=1 Tax=Cornus florida TaxID=4283 RepID=UPI00289ECE98|nr:uncharacterized protein LOC132293530 [Cornus florida]XP_059647038.1 uncharacterized protein LOC132293530 [Cornus florida]XP_059647040.1 uncharacterized protein LOC132293530 [Cornus florida]
MGKKLQQKRSGISVDNNRQGCMWGVLHVLHYHRWRCVKKMIPHRSRGGGKHDAGVENPGNEIKSTDAGEMLQEHVDTEMDNSLGEEKTTEVVAKRSVKSRIKALISEEVSKRKVRHRRCCSYPAQTQLTRTISIHRLEPLNLDHPVEAALNNDTPGNIHLGSEDSSAASTLDIMQSKVCEERVASNKTCELCATTLTMNYLGQSPVYESGKQPIGNHTPSCEKFNKAAQDLLEPRNDVSVHKSNQSLDSVGIFNREKELFLKILQDPSSPLAHHFHGRRAFNSKVGISKSVSFPLAGSSGRRSVWPSKLKHKQETKSRAEGEEKFKFGSQAETSVELESKEDISENSVSQGADYRVNCIPRSCLARSESVDKFSSVSPCQLNDPENKVAFKRIKNLRQKIKHAMKESKKEKYRISMDAILHKIPYGHRLSRGMKEETADFGKEPAMDRSSKNIPKSGCENHQSVTALSKGGLQSIRRTSSFDESLDRYCKLFESSFNKEAKNHISERVKSRAEEIPSSDGSSPKPLGRILSLPDLRSYLQNEESPKDMSSGIPIRTAVNSTLGRGNSRFDEQKTLGSENATVLDSKEDIGSQKVGESYLITEEKVGLTSLANDEAKAKVDWTLDRLGNLTTGESASHDEHEILHNSKVAEPSPNSVLDSNFQEDITSPANPSISEGLELKPRCLFFDGVDTSDSSANQQDETGMDSPTLAESKVDLEKKGTPTKQFNIDFPQVLVDTEDLAEFNYVRDVLELSGFSRNEFLGTWHSVDQPLDPSMFEEVEGYETDDSENEEGANSNNLLLFDLINEVLLEIYERSFMYCPIRLSSRSHIHPMPVGFHVLEEVWANISCCLRCRPEVDQSLDDAVSRDLAKSDGWMNLQFDAECVGLELEDMIFDDLLEELICT